MSTVTPEECAVWRERWEDARDEMIRLIGNPGAETEFCLRLLDALEAAKADAELLALAYAGPILGSSEVDAAVARYVRWDDASTRAPETSS